MNTGEYTKPSRIPVTHTADHEYDVIADEATSASRHSRLPDNIERLAVRHSLEMHRDDLFEALTGRHILGCQLQMQGTRLGAHVAHPTIERDAPLMLVMGNAQLVLPVLA